MNNSISERRLAENEVFFRQPNQKVVAQIRELEAIANEENYPNLVLDPTDKINFYCECADSKCRKRIKLTPRRYAKLHQNIAQFIILPGHQVAAIEKIVLETRNYMVVEKYKKPPEKALKLNKT